MNPQSVDERPDDSQRQEAEEELQQKLEHALRSALTHGVSVADVKILAYGCGISYDRIVGQK